MLESDVTYEQATRSLCLWSSAGTETRPYICLSAAAPKVDPPSRRPPRLLIRQVVVSEVLRPLQHANLRCKSAHAEVGLLFL